MNRLSAIVCALVIASANIVQAAGEAELVTVLAARVRYGLANPEMPDEPANLRLNNLERPKAAVEPPDEPEPISAESAIRSEPLQPIPEAFREALVLTKPIEAEPVKSEPITPKLCLFRPAGNTGFGKTHVRVYIPAVCRPHCGDCVRSSKSYENCGEGDDDVSVEWVTTDPPAHIARAMVGKGYPALVIPTTIGPDWCAAGEVLTLPSIKRKIVLVPHADRYIPPAMAGMGGSFQGRDVIQSMLDRWRQHVGDRELSFRWDRTGAQQIDLLHGEKWTPQQVCGKYGHVQLGGHVDGFPFDSIGFGYRLDDQSQLTIDPDPLTFALPGGPPAATAAGEACGVDPITIGWGLVSVARMLYAVLNPQVDLILGGNVACSAVLHDDILRLQFSECPGVRVQAWFEWKLEVEQLLISPTNIHVGFKEQPRSWFKIRSRDFPVE